MNARRWLAAAGLLLLVAGCSSSPTQPVAYTPLSALTLAPTGDTLLVGDQVTFLVTALDTNGVVVPKPAVQYESSNKSVFTVSEFNGAAVVHGQAEGTASLTASSGGITVSAPIMVLPPTRGWALQTSNTSNQLNDVCFLGDGNTGWAVGDAGTIMATVDAGRTWTRVSVTAYNLYGVWFTSADEGWIAGAAGTVLHTTNAGGSWSRVTLSTPTSATLYDVTFTDADHGWIVGSNGTILSTADHGVTWQKQNLTPGTLRAVAFSGLGDGWAVGDAGVIVGTHNDGASWFVLQPYLTGQNLRVVRWRDTSFANAAGDQGITPRTVSGPDSVVWEMRNAGAAYQLDGMFFTSPLTGYVVGYNGAGSILFTNDGGATWTTQTASTQFRLNAVHFIDSERGWAVGANGTVLHTVTGGAP